MIEAALTSRGAVVDVTIRCPPIWAQMDRANRDLLGTPDSFAGLAMIDTGAVTSCIHQATAARLGLRRGNPVRVLNVQTGHSSPQHAFEHPALVDIADLGTFDVQLLGLQQLDTDGEAPGGRVICLIGRDILNKCRLTWDGPRMRFTLQLA